MNAYVSFLQRASHDCRAVCMKNVELEVKFGDDTLQRSKCFFFFFKLNSGNRPLQPSCVFILCLTSLGLPGRDGGGVLRWRGGRALPLPLLHPGSLCLHCHAVCHSQGMETNCLQVSSFSACLPERPHFLILQPPLCSSTHRMSQPERVFVCVCVCVYVCVCA